MEDGTITKLDNDGKVRVMNRETRRRAPVTPNFYTKSTHQMKKLRSKNAKSKQQRKRAIANTRKARKQGDTQVS